MLRCNILKWIWRLIHKLQNGASKGQGSGCRGRNNNTRCYFRRISPERPTRPLETEILIRVSGSWREHISCLFWQRQIQIVFMGEAINKGKFVQATHYVVRLQSARFIVPILPSFSGIFGPCQPTTVFLSSLHNNMLRSADVGACFHFDVASLLEDISFKFEPHISSRHHICIFDISQDLGFSLI